MSTYPIGSGYVSMMPTSFDLNQKDAKRLFDLYNRFFSIALDKIGPIKKEEYAWMVKEFSDVKSCAYAWQDLRLSLRLDQMEKIWEETGVIQLRVIPKDAKTLIVGCGNCPIVDDGGYPLEAKSKNHSRSQNYRMTHAHLNAITINPHLAANPILVGFFGYQNFPMLKDGQFDLIAIEGAAFPETDLTQKELKRLLSPIGHVIEVVGDGKGYRFDLEHCIQNGWSLMPQDPEPLIENLDLVEAFKCS